jgi:2-dehydropantoate 2-reductase
MGSVYNSVGSTNTRPVIAIIGCGAIGSYYGARLVQGGHDVHFLMKSDFATVRSHGLTVSSCNGDLQLPPSSLNIYSDVNAMPCADWIIIALKTTSNHFYHKLVSPLLKANTIVITLQNGLKNEEQLGHLFGAERVIGGVAFICVNRITPGVINHTAHGLIRIADFCPIDNCRVQDIAAVFTSSNIPCEAVEDLARCRWEKLVWNIPFNALTGILRLTTDELLSNANTERLIRDLMSEVIEAAKRLGVILDSDLPDRSIQHTRQMDSFRTSMQIDMERGKPTEYESILGWPLCAGTKAGASMPLVTMLYRMISAREQAINGVD